MAPGRDRKTSRDKDSKRVSKGNPTNSKNSKEPSQSNPESCYSPPMSVTNDVSPPIRCESQDKSDKISKRLLTDEIITEPEFRSTSQNQNKEVSLNERLLNHSPYQLMVVDPQDKPRTPGTGFYDCYPSTCQSNLYEVKDLSFESVSNLKLPETPGKNIPLDHTINMPLKHRHSDLHMEHKGIILPSTNFQNSNLEKEDGSIADLEKNCDTNEKHYFTRIDGSSEANDILDHVQSNESLPYQLTEDLYSSDHSHREAFTSLNYENLNLFGQTINNDLVRTMSPNDYDLAGDYFHNGMSFKNFENSLGRPDKVIAECLTQPYEEVHERESPSSTAEGDAFHPRTPGRDTSHHHTPDRDTLHCSTAESDTFHPRTPDRDAFHPRTPGRDIFSLRATGRDIFHLRTPGKDTFPSSTSGKNSFHPRTPDRDFFPPRNPGRDIFTPRTPGRDIFPPRTPGKDIFPPLKPGRDIFHPRTTGREISSRTPDRDIFPPRTPDRDIFSPHTPGRDTSPPRTPGRDVFPPRTPGKDVFPPRTSGRDIFPPRTPGRDIFPPRTPGRDIFPPRTPGKDVFPPRTPGRDVFPPRTPGRDVLPPRTPSRDIFPPHTPSRDTFPPRTPGRDIFPPRTPSKDVFPPRTPGRDVFPTCTPGRGAFPPRTPGRGAFPPRTPGRGAFPPRTPGRGAFPPRTPGRGAFPPRTPGRGAFPPRTPGRGAFPPRTPGRGAFPPRTPGRGAFPPRTPSRGAFPPRTPGRGAFPPRTPGRGAFPPRPPGRGAFPPRPPGRGAFPPITPRTDAFLPFTLGRGAFPPLTPSRGAFPPLTPGRDAFPPLNLGRVAIPPLTPGRGVFPPLTPGRGVFPPLTPGRGVFPPLTPGRSPFPPLTPDRGSFPPLTPGRGIFPPLTPGRGVFPPLFPGRGVFSPLFPGSDFFPHHTPGRYIFPSHTPGRDVSLSCTPGRDVSLSCTPGRDVSLSCTPGRDVSLSCTPGRDVSLSCTTARDPTSSRTPDRDAISSLTPGRDVISSCTSCSDAISLPIPSRDAISSPIPSRDAISSPIPSRDAIPSPIPSRDAIPSPISCRDAIPSPISCRDAIPSPISCRDAIPSRTPGRDAIPSRTPGRDVIPSRTPGRDAIPSRTPGRDAIPSRTPGRDAIPSRTPGRDAIPSRTPGRDAIPSRTPGRDAIPSRTPGRDVIPSRTPGRDAIPSRTPGRDAIPSRTPGRDAIPSRTSGRDAIPSRTSGRDAIPSRTPGRDAIPSRTPGRDAIPSRTPGRDAIPSRTPGRDAIPSRTPGRDAIPYRTPGREVIFSCSPGRETIFSRSPGREAISSRTPISDAISSRTPVSDAISSCTPVSDAISSCTPVSDAISSCTPVSDAISSCTPVSDAISSRTPVSDAISSRTPVSDAIPSCIPGRDSSYNSNNEFFSPPTHGESSCTSLDHTVKNNPSHSENIHPSNSGEGIYSTHSFVESCHSSLSLGEGNPRETTPPRQPVDELFNNYRPLTPGGGKTCEDLVQKFNNDGEFDSLIPFITTYPDFIYKDHRDIRENLREYKFQNESQSKKIVVDDEFLSNYKPPTPGRGTIIQDLHMTSNECVWFEPLDYEPLINFEEFNGDQVEDQSINYLCDQNDLERESFDSEILVPNANAEDCNESQLISENSSLIANEEGEVNNPENDEVPKNLQLISCISKENSDLSGKDYVMKVYLASVSYKEKKDPDLPKIDVSTSSSELRTDANEISELEMNCSRSMINSECSSSLNSHSRNRSRNFADFASSSSWKLSSTIQIFHESFDSNIENEHLNLKTTKALPSGSVDKRNFERIQANYELESVFNGPDKSEISTSEYSFVGFDCMTVGKCNEIDKSYSILDSLKCESISSPFTEVSPKISSLMSKNTYSYSIKDSVCNEIISNKTFFSDEFVECKKISDLESDNYIIALSAQSDFAVNLKNESNENATSVPEALVNIDVIEHKNTDTEAGYLKNFNLCRIDMTKLFLILDLGRYLSNYFFENSNNALKKYFNISLKTTELQAKDSFPYVIQQQPIVNQESLLCEKFGNISVDSKERSENTISKFTDAVSANSSSKKMNESLCENMKSPDFNKETNDIVDGYPISRLVELKITQEMCVFSLNLESELPQNQDIAIPYTDTCAKDIDSCNKNSHEHEIHISGDDLVSVTPEVEIVDCFSPKSDTNENEVIHSDISKRNFNINPTEEITNWNIHEASGNNSGDVFTVNAKPTNFCNDVNYLELISISPMNKSVDIPNTGTTTTSEIDLDYKYHELEPKLSSIDVSNSKNLQDFMCSSLVTSNLKSQICHPSHAIESLVSNVDSKNLTCKLDNTNTSIQSGVDALKDDRPSKDNSNMIEVLMEESKKNEEKQMECSLSNIVTDFKIEGYVDCCIEPSVAPNDNLEEHIEQKPEIRYNIQSTTHDLSIGKENEMLHLPMENSIGELECTDKLDLSMSCSPVRSIMENFNFTNDLCSDWHKDFLVNISPIYSKDEFSFDMHDVQVRCNTLDMDYECNVKSYLERRMEDDSSNDMLTKSVNMKDVPSINGSVNLISISSASRSSKISHCAMDISKCDESRSLSMFDEINSDDDNLCSKPLEKIITDDMLSINAVADTVKLKNSPLMSISENLNGASRIDVDFLLSSAEGDSLLSNNTKQENESNSNITEDNIGNSSHGLSSLGTNFKDIHLSSLSNSEKLEISIASIEDFDSKSLANNTSNINSTMIEKYSKSASESILQFVENEDLDNLFPSFQTQNFSDSQKGILESSEGIIPSKSLIDCANMNSQTLDSSGKSVFPLSGNYSDSHDNSSTNECVNSETSRCSNKSNISINCSINSEDSKISAPTTVDDVTKRKIPRKIMAPPKSSANRIKTIIQFDARKYKTGTDGNTTNSSPNFLELPGISAADEPEPVKFIQNYVNKTQEKGTEGKENISCRQTANEDTFTHPLNSSDTFIKPNEPSGDKLKPKAAHESSTFVSSSSGISSSESIDKSSDWSKNVTNDFEKPQSTVELSVYNGTGNVKYSINYPVQNLPKSTKSDLQSSKMDIPRQKKSFCDFSKNYKDSLTAGSKNDPTKQKNPRFQLTTNDCYKQRKINPPNSMMNSIQQNQQQIVVPQNQCYVLLPGTNNMSNVPNSSLMMPNYYKMYDPCSMMGPTMQVPMHDLNQTHAIGAVNCQKPNNMLVQNPVRLIQTPSNNSTVQGKKSKVALYNTTAPLPITRQTPIKTVKFDKILRDSSFRVPSNSKIDRTFEETNFNSSRTRSTSNSDHFTKTSLFASLASQGKTNPEYPIYAELKSESTRNSRAQLPPLQYSVNSIQMGLCKVCANLKLARYPTMKTLRKERRFVYEFELSRQCRDKLSASDILTSCSMAAHEKLNPFDEWKRDIGDNGGVKIHLRVAIPFESLQLCTINELNLELVLTRTPLLQIWLVDGLSRSPLKLNNLLDKETLSHHQYQFVRQLRMQLPTSPVHKICLASINQQIELTQTLSVYCQWFSTSLQKSPIVADDQDFLPAWALQPSFEPEIWKANNAYNVKSSTIKPKEYVMIDLTKEENEEPKPEFVNVEVVHPKSMSSTSFSESVTRCQPRTSFVSSQNTKTKIVDKFLNFGNGNNMVPNHVGPNPEISKQTDSMLKENSEMIDELLDLVNNDKPLSLDEAVNANEDNLAFFNSLLKINPSDFSVNNPEAGTNSDVKLPTTSLSENNTNSQFDNESVSKSNPRMDTDVDFFTDINEFPLLNYDWAKLCDDNNNEVCIEKTGISNDGVSPTDNNKTAVKDLEKETSLSSNTVPDKIDIVFKKTVEVQKVKTNLAVKENPVSDATQNTTSEPIMISRNINIAVEDFSSSKNLVELSAESNETGMILTLENDNRTSLKRTLGDLEPVESNSKKRAIENAPNEVTSCNKFVLTSNNSTNDQENELLKESDINGSQCGPSVELPANTNAKTLHCTITKECIGSPGICSNSENSNIDLASRNTKIACDESTTSQTENNSKNLGYKSPKGSQITVHESSGVKFGSTKASDIDQAIHFKSTKSLPINDINNNEIPEKNVTSEANVANKPRRVVKQYSLDRRLNELKRILSNHAINETETKMVKVPSNDSIERPPSSLNKNSQNAIKKDFHNVIPRRNIQTPSVMVNYKCKIIKSNSKINKVLLERINFSESNLKDLPKFSGKKILRLPRTLFTSTKTPSAKPRNIKITSVSTEHRTTDARRILPLQKSSENYLHTSRKDIESQKLKKSAIENISSPPLIRLEQAISHCESPEIVVLGTVTRDKRSSDECSSTAAKRFKKGSSTRASIRVQVPESKVEIKHYQKSSCTSTFGRISKEGCIKGVVKIVDKDQISRVFPVYVHQKSNQAEKRSSESLEQLKRLLIDDAQHETSPITPTSMINKCPVTKVACQETDTLNLPLPKSSKPVILPSRPKLYNKLTSSPTLKRCTASRPRPRPPIFKRITESGNENNTNKIKRHEDLKIDETPSSGDTVANKSKVVDEASQNSEVIEKIHDADYVEVIDTIDKTKEKEEKKEISKRSEVDHGPTKKSIENQTFNKKANSRRLINKKSVLRKSNTIMQENSRTFFKKKKANKFSKRKGRIQELIKKVTNTCRSIENMKTINRGSSKKTHPSTNGLLGSKMREIEQEYSSGQTDELSEEDWISWSPDVPNVDLIFCEGVTETSLPNQVISFENNSLLNNFAN